MKKAAVIVFFFLLLIPLFASKTEEITINIIDNDDSVNWYRYKVNEGEWNLQSSSNKTITVNYEEGNTDLVTIQSSISGNLWSCSHRVLISPYDKYLINWEWDDSSSSWYKYRIDGRKEEIVVNSKVQAIEREVEEGNKYSFAISSSNDKENWTEEREGKLTVVKVPYEEKNPVKFELNGRVGTSLSIIDFYNGHNIEDAQYLTVTKPGIKVGIEGRIVKDYIRAFIGFDYTKVNKKTTVIYNAFSIEYYRAHIGYDCILPLFKNASLYFGVGISPTIEINANKWSPSIYMGGRIGFEYSITNNLSIGLESGIEATLHKAEEPLYESQTYIIDPVSLTVGVRF